MNSIYVNILAVFVIITMLNPVTSSSLQNFPAIKPDYVFPVPGSTLLNKETNIIVRYAGSVDPQKITDQTFAVTGEVSGNHAGRIVLSDDLSTVVFTPEVPFAAGETVSVLIIPSWVDSGGANFSFSFRTDPLEQTARPSPDSLLDLAPPGMQPAAVTDSASTTAFDYLTLPGDFPSYTVDVPASPENQGYYFLAPFQIFNQTGNYLLIVDNTGEPVYYQAVPFSSSDFKKQPNGLLSYFDRANWGYAVLDSTYQNVGIYSAKNGYVIDPHEFIMLPNHHCVYMIYDTKIIDMTAIIGPSGDPQAEVEGLVIQEQDGSGNVVFEWRSWDHMPITDADPNIDLTAHSIDYVHGNAIQLDWDGNYMISSRHLSEITKINRRTGEIIWRLGGKNNQFTFTNIDISQSLPFSFQHDIRRLPNGHITLFDNRNNLSPLYSSAVEYDMNEDTKTITRVWEYQTSIPGVFSMAMGNAQRLANGNTVIGWGFNSNFPTGKQPDVTEAKADGTKVFEMTFDLAHINYRAFRFDWTGNPAWPPTLAFNVDGGLTTFGASWNGATEVAQYELYGAQNLIDPPQLINAKPKAGFETQWNLAIDHNSYCYFEVKALDKDGVIMSTSNQVKTLGCLPYKVAVPMVSR